MLNINKQVTPRFQQLLGQLKAEKYKDMMAKVLVLGSVKHNLQQLLF